MYIGLDIGGYKINGVLMRGNKIVRKRLTLMKSKSDKKIIIAQIFDCIEYLIKEVNKKEIKGIGIGVPGPIDFKKQKILNPPNVTGLKNVFLAKIVREKFKIKTKIENDANCFGLAEAVFGAGKSKKIVAGLTLGTGVGGFVIINKKIFRGKSPRATEFGHKIKIIKNGRKCNCGNRGCLEAYISAKIPVREKEKYLKIGVINLVKILDPDIVVIGGGLANIIALPLIKNTKVVRAKLGENAGAIGAALLVKFYPQLIHNKD